jgi:hypothetical protein
MVERYGHMGLAGYRLAAIFQERRATDSLLFFRAARRDRAWTWSFLYGQDTSLRAAMR